MKLYGSTRGGTAGRSETGEEEETRRQREAARCVCVCAAVHMCVCVTEGLLAQPGLSWQPDRAAL